MEPPYVEDLRRIRQMRDQHHEEFATTHLRDLRRIRWYFLGLNLVCAAVYLIPPIKSVAFFTVPFHMAVGISIFVFLTKTYKRLLREFTISKLKREP